MSELTDFLTNIADAIRYAEDSTDIIAATEFYDRIVNLSRKKKLIATFDVAGTYTWTIPESVKRKGYLDVFLMGGGGSGGVSVVRSSHTGKYNYTAATGGAAGYVTKVTDYIVNSTDTSISIVVGAGGASATATGTAESNPQTYFYGRIMNGNQGGTTSFGAYTALGGEGGKANRGVISGADVKGANGSAGSVGIDGKFTGTVLSPASHGANGGVCTTASTIPTDLIGTGQGVSNVQNNYALDEIIGAAGASSYSYIGDYGDVYAKGSTSGVVTSRGKSGNSYGGYANYNSNATTITINSTAYDATGNGNGGGAITYSCYADSATYDLRSGKGSDGLVLIFA